MNKIKILYFFSFFLLIGCSTFRFGTQDDLLVDPDETKSIREFKLNYSYKIMGVPVKGIKSIVESSIIHPDGETMILFISFPKIGFLQTNDGGSTFNSQFFRLTFFEKAFDFTDDPKDDDNKIKTPKRFFSHFAVSPNDPDKIVFTIGPYIFISKDRGIKWDHKSIFFDIDKVNIRDVFISKEDQIIVITENKIAISNNWGKKWSKKPFKIENIPAFKLEYVTGLFDSDTETLYASIKHNSENDYLLSFKSFEYFNYNKTDKLLSGLFYSNDYGDTWIKSDIPVPVNLWKNNDTFYASSIYPLGLYNYNFDDKFKKSKLYSKGELKTGTANINDFYKIMLERKPEDYMILSNKNNTILKFNKINENIDIYKEDEFDNLYIGIKKIQDLDYINWKNYWYDEKKSENFFYEYNMFKVFQKWMGMRINSPILYTKDKKNDIYYRIRPDEKFYRAFVKYCIENQIKLNSKNPFLKKSSDVEFFDPSQDPTNGFPVVIEFSQNNGKTWKRYIDSAHVRNIIDPLSNKRSGFFWYKNVDQKKMKKLQVSFGWSEGADLNVYPMDLNIYNGELLMRINYFSLIKTYKDMYLIPINK